ncbi:hypothetical protein DSL64_02275 [Dyadobacter luteus]|uniref:Uncharacterized protein n=1 Tax=Dyadobacter luteus TaxID=2259619 RepID=A0A3D8YHS6_9BACT|nr:hypothetical protein [Dyadobacter luteus]REA64399.1 hypothetical protein DSL64_02275 [Dyadobacter luteus]
MKYFFMIVFAFFIYQSAYSQNNVGINTDTPDQSAVLDILSTQKGVLIPRMSFAQKNLISAPAKGLLIYQIDAAEGFYFYNGSAWQTLNGVNGANGANGQGFANGSAAGQLYLTSGSSPFSPQAPVSVTGDITINNSGSTTITSGAVNTTKLANGSVTIQKINAAGTASPTTFLRGDGEWAAPAAAGASASTLFARRTTDLLVESNAYQDVVSINLEANKTYLIQSKVLTQRAGSASADVSCRVKFSTNDAVSLIGGVYYGTGYKTGTNFSSSGGFESDGVSDNPATQSVGAKYTVETIIKTVTAGTFTIQVARKSNNTTNNFYVRPISYITASTISE